MLHLKIHSFTAEFLLKIFYSFLAEASELLFWLRGCGVLQLNFNSPFSGGWGSLDFATIFSLIPSDSPHQLYLCHPIETCITTLFILNPHLRAEYPKQKVVFLRYEWYVFPRLRCALGVVSLILFLFLLLVITSNWIRTVYDFVSSYCQNTKLICKP